MAIVKMFLEINKKNCRRGVNKLMTNFFNSKKKSLGAIDVIGQSVRPMRVKKNWRHDT